MWYYNAENEIAERTAANAAIVNRFVESGLFKIAPNEIVSSYDTKLWGAKPGIPSIRVNCDNVTFNHFYSVSPEKALRIAAILAE